MKRFLSCLTLLGLSLTFTSCKDEKLIYINPDGGVKIEFDLEFSIESEIATYAYSNDGEANKKEVAKNIVRKYIEENDHVYAWAGLNWNLVGSQKMQFSGVAYLQRPTSLDLEINGLRFGNTPVLEILDNGEFIARFDSTSFNSDEEEKTWEELSQEKRQEYLQEAKDSLTKTQGMLQVMGNFSEKYTYLFKGKTLEIDLFEEIPSGFRSVTNQEIAQMHMDALDGNDDLLVELIKDGFGRGGEVSYTKNYALFGKPVPRFAKFLAEEDIFDFEKEVKNAQQAFPELMKSLQLAGIPERTEKSTEALDVIFTGLQISYHDFEDFRKRPYGDDQGIEYAFLLKAPPNSFSFVEAEISEIVYDNGKKGSLVNDAFKGISQSSFSKDRQYVEMKSRIYQLPEKNIRGIRKLAGQAVFLCSDGSETFSFENISSDENEISDIGKKDLRIKKLQFSKNDDEVEIKIRFNEDRELIKAVRVFNSNGREYKVINSGHSGNEMRYQIEEKVDKFLRFEVECYRNVFKHVSPFAIENLDWLGRPME